MFWLQQVQKTAPPLRRSSVPLCEWTQLVTQVNPTTNVTVPRSPRSSVSTSLRLHSLRLRVSPTTTPFKSIGVDKSDKIRAVIVGWYTAAVQKTDEPNFEVLTRTSFWP